MLRFWRCHSRTVVCLAAGTLITGPAWIAWPDGGSAWDVASGLGSVLLGFGLEGIVNIWTEINKAEE